MYTIEILPLDYDTLTYDAIVMDEGGEVVERRTFAHDRYLVARGWAKAMRRRYGGEIIDHTPVLGNAR